MALSLKHVPIWQEESSGHTLRQQTLKRATFCLYMKIENELIRKSSL